MAGVEAKEWDDRYAGDELVWSAEPNQFVETHLAGLVPGDAIDLAAGEGRNAVWLARRGWRATAVDFSPIALDKARRRAAAHDVELTTIEADLRTWTPPPSSADLALIAYLQLPHPQEASVIARAGAALRPSGVFFFVAHDRSNIDDGYGGPQDPAVLPDVELVVGALDGFDVEVAEVVTRRVETDEGTRTALDTLVMARRRA